MTTPSPEHFFAPRMARFEPSRTNLISQRARDLAAEGHDVIRLSSGEPDFDAPTHIRDAAKQALDAGRTRNTNIDGLPELKEAIKRKFKRENELDVELDQIGVATGAKQVIFNALMATVSEGDEVIIPAPYWVSYPQMVRLAGGTPVPVATEPERGFVLEPERLEDAITPRTKWLIINNPGNPSGAVWDRDSLRTLGDVLARHEHVHVLTDDIYEHIIYDNATFTTFAAAVPAMASRTLTVNGVSKAYCMMGFRIGFACGPEPLIKAMRTLQSQETSNPNSIGQYAAIAALDGPKDFLLDHVARYRRRRDMAVDSLNACSGLRCLMPRGAFYAFANCAGVIGLRTPDGTLIADDEAFSTYLLDAYHVAVTPGTAFGMPGHFRVSYAAAEADIKEACRRINEAVASLT
jgi:aspartate aminotransferase